MEWQDATLRPDLERQGVTARTIKDIEEFVSPETLEWAKWQLEFYSDYHAGVNEIHRAMTYTDMHKGENYSPTRRDYTKGDQQDMTLDGTASYIPSMWKGSIKQRVKNQLNLKWTDGDSVLSQHIAEMEHFKAWAIPIRQMRRVFGSHGVGAAIEDFHGPSAKAVVNDFINRFTSGNVEARSKIEFLDSLRSGFTKMALGGNFVVLAKQLTSFPAYAMDIPTNHFMRGLTYSMTHPMEAAKVLSSSSMMQSRGELNQIERDYALATKRPASRQLAGTKSLSEFAMVLTKLGDKAAIILGGYSVYNYHRNILGKTHEEAIKAFEISTESAQQATGVKDLSVQQSGGSVQKGLTMFMTTPASYMRHWEAGMRGIAQGRGNISQNLKRIAITQVVLPIMFQLVASGGEWDEQKLKRAVALGPFNGLFIWRDIISGLADMAFLGKTWGDPSAPHLKELYAMSMELIDGEFGLDDVTQMVAATRSPKGLIASLSGETEHPIRRSLGWSESALEPIETSYNQWNHKFNQANKRFKKAKSEGFKYTGPRIPARLRNKKKQISRAKKRGDRELELALKKEFVKMAKETF